MWQEFGPGNKIDLLTQQELKETLGHHFDAYIREVYRGVKGIRFIKVVNAGTWTSDAVPNGYVWVPRHLAVSLSAPDQVIVSLGDTAVAPATPAGYPGIVTVFPSGTNPIAFASTGFASHEFWLNPGEQITAIPFTTTHNILNVTFTAIEVPAEMIGKVLL